MIYRWPGKPRTAYLYAVLLLLATSNACAGLFDKFIDPQSGDFDTSDWLLEHRGILPVPIIISDPAVGYGLGVAGAYFHWRKGGDDLDEEGVPLTTPSVSALAAAYTENDSWFVGGGHLGIWKDDHVRYAGVLGYADLNLTFYAGNQSDGFGGFDFEIQGTFIDQELISSYRREQLVPRRQLPLSEFGCCVSDRYQRAGS